MIKKRAGKTQFSPLTIVSYGRKKSRTICEKTAQAPQFLFPAPALPQKQSPGPFLRSAGHPLPGALPPVWVSFPFADFLSPRRAPRFPALFCT
ncbi:MAG: hypothetical protein ACLUR9_07100 [Christensenellales bacterium]